LPIQPAGGVGSFAIAKHWLTFECERQFLPKLFRALLIFAKNSSMEAQELQQVFFRHIRSLLPTNISLAEEIAERLNISNDSAYRRIRGDKGISLEEVRTLAKHYGISLDRLMNVDSDAIIFSGKPLGSEDFDFAAYLNETLANLKLIDGAKQKMMYYEAKDLPIFYYYQFTELAAFKYFFWIRNVLCSPEYSKMRHFEDNELQEAIHKTGREIIQTYCRIPSTEIWGAESLHATLRQIEYFKETGVFKKKESIELIFTQFKQLIEHVREQAEQGEKFLAGTKPRGQKDNYSLYYNQVFLGHNSVLVDADGATTAFLNHGVMNYIGTRDAGFCAYTRNSIENTMKKSALISTVSDKERNKLFNLLLDKIDAERELMLK
jgi:hypothetical protein